MNPPPSPHIVSIMTLLFIIAVIYFTVKELMSNKEPLRIDDLFTIGYIERSDLSVNVINKVESKNAFETQQIYTDCIEALCSLGMKKTEAKKRAKQIFSTNPPNSVQEFLMIALRN